MQLSGRSEASGSARAPLRSVNPTKKLAGLQAWLEAGLCLVALLFLPLLVVVPRGIAALATVAMVIGAGLVLSQSGRPVLSGVATVPAAIFAALVVWGLWSALWSPDPMHSLPRAAKVTALVVAAVGMGTARLVSAPRRLMLFLLAGFTIALLMTTVDLASGGAISKPFSDRVYQPAWLNQVSVAFAILLLPTSAALIEAGHRLFGVVFAAAVTGAVFALVGTAAKVALACGVPVALLCYYHRAAVSRIAAVLSVLAIVTAPFTFARIDHWAGLVHTADSVKLSAGHRLLIWSFVGDRIAEHPVRGWGLELLRVRSPAAAIRFGLMKPGCLYIRTTLLSRFGLSSASRAQSVRVAGRLVLARCRPRRLAAALRCGGMRQSRHGLCRICRHLWRLAGVVAGHLGDLAFYGLNHGASSDFERRAGVMRVFTALPMRHWCDAAPFALAAEEAGFDGLMTVELGHDPFPPLAFAALATRHIALTTSVAVAFPRSPTVIASQAWDLHANSSGRFVLGLGSQVKGHNERRFGIAWSPPAPRLRDYVLALRAIWRCWETGGPLDYQGEHYRLTLMTPDFSPEPTGLPPIPVAIAAVGEAMLRVAGEVCDGVRLHPLCSRRYLEEVCLPQIREGMRRGGRDRRHFELHGGGFVVTGPDEAAVAAGVDQVRRRVAFYGSTRSYRPILALHGLDDLGLKLHRLSVEQRWNEMAAEVSDEVVRLFAACGTYRDIAAAIEARFGGLADAVDLNFAAGAPAGLQRELLKDIRRIPGMFEGFLTGEPPNIDGSVERRC